MTIDMLVRLFCLKQSAFYNKNLGASHASLVKDVRMSLARLVPMIKAAAEQTPWRQVAITVTSANTGRMMSIHTDNFTDVSSQKSS